MTQYAPPSFDIPARPIKTSLKISKAPKIGIAYDEAFCFYYPQNIEALKRMGYACSFFSPLKDKKLPNVEALYFGGGFPEIYAEKLSKNTQLRTEIKNFAEDYGDIFAECGGYMYLCSSLKIKSDNKIENKKRNRSRTESHRTGKDKTISSLQCFSSNRNHGEQAPLIRLQGRNILGKTFFLAKRAKKLFTGTSFTGQTLNCMQNTTRFWKSIKNHLAYAIKTFSPRICIFTSHIF